MNTVTESKTLQNMDYITFSAGKTWQRRLPVQFLELGNLEEVSVHEVLPGVRFAGCKAESSDYAKTQDATGALVNTFYPGDISSRASKGNFTVDRHNELSYVGPSLFFMTKGITFGRLEHYKNGVDNHVELQNPIWSHSIRAYPNFKWGEEKRLYGSKRCDGYKRDIHISCHSGVDLRKLIPEYSQDRQNQVKSAVRTFGDNMRNIGSGCLFVDKKRRVVRPGTVILEKLDIISENGRREYTVSFNDYHF